MKILLVVVSLAVAIGLYLATELSFIPGTEQDVDRLYNLNENGPWGCRKSGPSRSVAMI